MTFFREKISDKPPKNHQLDLFTPDDGTYEYSVICSNKKLIPANLLAFYNGRCAMEHHIAEIKGEFAFDSIPTQHYQGNSAYQQISILAYNLVRNFQIDAQLTSERKRTASFPRAKRWILCQETKARSVGGVQILPWMQGLETLFNRPGGFHDV